MHHTTRLAFALAAGLGLAGCAGMSLTEQRVGTGALGGGAIGGVLGSFSGNAGLGALLGAGVGAGGGYLYDQSQRDQQRYAGPRYDRRSDRRYDPRRQ
jgi:hypothetical protein